MTNIALRPSYWASVSGGKDSLYMLKLILEHPDKYPLTGVVHFELEIDYPFIKTVIEYMENECAKIGVPFVRIKPRVSWYDYYKRWGFPTRKARWCNSQYKIDCRRQLEKIMRDNGYYTVFYIGFCADENKRFKVGSEHTDIYPLAIENIYEYDILQWAKTQPIFNDFYLYNKRCGCMFCPLSSMIENAYLLKYYPSRYAELMRMCYETEQAREKELNRPFSIWQSNPKYNTAYRDRMIRVKYLPKIIKEVKL